LRRHLLLPLVSLSILAAAPTARAEDLPRLDWDKPIHCIRDPTGKVVRMQCDGAGKGARCLVAPNEMPEIGGELQRVQDCLSIKEPEEYSALVRAGAKMIPAIAEAPPGYERAPSGRAYQVKFDLLRRLYIGLAWVPTFQKPELGLSTPDNFPFGRAQAEVGLHISVLSPRGRARHDIRLIEGSATFSDLELKGTLFTYDYQHLHRRPAFWLTTFFGPPRVYGIKPGIGWGMRLININDRPPAFRDTLDMEIGELHLSYNPWQSNDMYSHIRLEVGGDFGKYWEDRGELSQKGLGTGLWYGGLSSALKTRFSLGEGGLHYIFMDVAYLRPTILSEDAFGKSFDRVSATFAYEGIFLAINDQPLSFRVAAQGSSRTDPVTDMRSMEVRLTAGLRFSFWAPPRVFEPLPPIEDP